MREEGSQRLRWQASCDEDEGSRGTGEEALARLGPQELDRLTRRAESEVKRRLARELHDSVAQILTQMVVDMESFKLDQSGQHQVVERVGHLQESTREVLANLRQLLYELREEPSIDNGFVQSVRQLLSRFERSTGIRSKLRVSAHWPSGISAAAAHHLYRIVEEALNNVRLHSGAARVDVLLQAVGDGVALTVRDDGRGLQRLGGERGGSMGLLGMRERAALLGGEVNIISRGGRGTTVRAVVPRIAKEMSR
ncbi:MAG TPA: sensor histidine kinase [Candidatus Dormibacteraeota bacterium]|jgi:two-component system sensor histidine kinase UhpB|nr:sensor histidine kinase [Candidatus Dormibacteraeota bacterium]